MTDVSAGFRPPCWCPSRWAPAWRLLTNLYKKKLGKTFLRISSIRKIADLNLGESLCISTFFLFPDSRLIQLNGFYFFILIYFEWRDTENQQLCFCCGLNAIRLCQSELSFKSLHDFRSNEQRCSSEASLL